MSISGITSSIPSPSDVQQPLRSKVQEFRRDFGQLGKDLQAGDVSAAQSDLSALMQVMPQSGSVTPGAVSSNPIAQGFHQLAVDLRNGNVSAAQQDYSTLQQAISSRAAGVRHHLHSRAAHTRLNQLFQQLGSALESGDVSNARHLFAAIQQQFGQTNAATVPSTSTSGLSVNV